MSTLNIRLVEFRDAPAIQGLLAQLGYPDFTTAQAEERIQLHQASGYAMLVAVAQNQVVAFAALHWFQLAHWHGPMGRITAFCVDAGFRSQGVGQQLLGACEAFLFSKGCLKLEVTSNERREKAHQFYRKAGYTEDSRRFVKYAKAG
ncbi:MAG: GNAT family N-acetyltransferase [Cyclobacteriaceae bacterium]|jgi:GNAT superfamily N-acetyltransferase|nr:GNAT family N-acetyltransferase [Cyclobacteriaceae bacterium]